LISGEQVDISTIAITLALLVVACLGIVSVIPGEQSAHQGALATLCVFFCAVAIVLSVSAAQPGPAGMATIAVATITAATFAGWPVTAAILQVALKVATTEPNMKLPASGWIGLAERFGFSLALILGLPEVAALIVGVKALGTYATPTEPGDTTPAARVLGTLTSVGWALFASTAYLVISV
jgi:hypothetical protein